MTDSVLADALSDPGVDALLGMSQGFASAAMPTRMPTPFGAVIGADAGGALQGIKTSQGLAEGQQQLLASKMANMATASGLPLTVAKNQMLQGVWSNPDLVRQLMNGGSAPSTPSAAMPGDVFAQRIQGGENATGNPAALNASGPGGTPTSSAMGNGQFIEGTWLPLYKQMYPDKAAGMTDAQILAQRADPTASAAMTTAYAAQNAPILQAAGVAPHAANLAMAHRYGPEGAIAVAQAAQNAPGTPLSALLSPDAIKANPTWANQTAGQVAGSNMMRFGTAPVDFSGAGSGNITVPAGMPGAGTLITPAQALAASQDYERRAQMAGAAQQFGVPNANDPAMLRATGQKYLDLALAGSKSYAEAAGKAPFQDTRVNAGGILYDGAGNVKGFAPIQSDEVVAEGPNFGAHVTVLRNPINNTIIQGPGVRTVPNGTTLAPPASAVPTPLSPTTPPATGGPKVAPTGTAPFVPSGSAGLPPGAILKQLPPQTVGRLTAQGQVEGHDIEHDRKTIEEDLAHVLDNAQPAQQQLLQLRGLAPDAYTGFAGDFRSQVRNFFQTFMPQGLSDLAPDAAPAQEFAKVALMQAGKQERGDLGSRGGFRAIEMYADANPNLNMQEVANGHMANALLVSQQRGVDYANGATDHYLNNRAGFMDPTNPKPYSPISAYDQQFTKVMKPELYYSAIQAINGKPQAEWSKGLDNRQMQIVGGIVRRADPNAMIDIKGKQVPVSHLNNLVSPSDILSMQPTGGSGG